MDLISVIVPVYNVEEYLEKCLLSIINQTYQNLEIILIDDGSTDSSGIICEQYKEKDKRIKVIHKENGGLSSARNIGVEQASGTWVAFVDSDDYIEVTMYEILLKLAIENKADIALAHFRSFDSNEIEACVDSDNIITFKEHELLEVYILGDYHISTSVWDRLYRKTLIEEIIFPKGKLHEDILYTIEAFYKCNKAVYIDHAYYYYRIGRDKSIMAKQYDFKNLTDLLDLTNQAADYLRDHDEKKLASLYVTKRYLEFSDILGKKITIESKNLIEKYLNQNKKEVFKAFFNKEIRNKEKILLILTLVSPDFKINILKIYMYIRGKKVKKQ